jgi:asparagine synthase (glutamine-hydrolysing)
MSDASESIWVTFNGELYNYKALRLELEVCGRVFRSQSDTEVLVHGYAEWGSEIFKKIDGMWALALYDKKAGKLLLSRDPAGIKPLYIYQKGQTLLFASEIGALRAAVGSQALSVSEAGVARFLAHGYLYDEHTIYNEIMRLPQGCVRTYTLPSLSIHEESIYTPTRRYEIHSMEEGVAHFDKLFGDSVRATLQSDAPIGLFLSGGIDSSLTGYHIKEAGANLTAFTIGFAEQSFDESSMATRIAKHIGFPHVTRTMRGADIADDIERILDSFGEPFADTSALPTYYLSALAREHDIKVALGGDGADELFGGYQTHYLPHFAEAYRRTPEATDAILQTATKLLPAGYTKLGNREKLTRFANAARNPYQEAHARWKRVFTEEELGRLLQPAAHAAAIKVDTDFKNFFTQIQASSQNKMDEVMKVDFFTFLYGSCLVKSDISSMQHGLEIRVPFLTKDLIDFAWYLPTKYKTGPFSTKRLLRKALARHVPDDIARMRKLGFVPPLALWLTNELKPSMLRILSREEVAKVGFLEYAYIVSLIDDHLAGRVDNSKKIWALMSLVRFFSKLTD